MPYRISFKDKYTGGRWVSQNKNILHPTLKGAKKTAEYMKNQHDPEGNLVKTQVRIRKVKGTRPKRRRRRK